MYSIFWEVEQHNLTLASENLNTVAKKIAPLLNSTHLGVLPLRPHLVWYDQYIVANVSEC